MQIDGHHTVTYTLARMAGFKHEEADIISYAAQYVDDATNAGTINFTNGATFSRISSAHGMSLYDISYYTDAHENNLVWVPFHFLPGNNKQTVDSTVEGSFINKLVCKPYSDPAIEMIDKCIENKDKPYALHRLGITMHVFADTYAHQDFAGKLHDINKVEDLECHNFDLGFFDSHTSSLLNRRFPMGHGAALTCPDMPFLEWSYTNGLGERKNRKNLNIFMEACEHMYAQFTRYLSAIGREDDILDIHDNDREKIRENFMTFISDDEKERHDLWLKSLSKGDFSFGAVKLEYIPKGIGSWKYQAIEQDKEVDEDDDKFEFKEEFLTSHWRNFHVALKAHRFDVINDILPKYGISVS